MRLAERARERRRKVDTLETVIVGQNAFRRDDQTDDFGEVFRLDPTAAARVTAKYDAIRASRDNAAVETSLDRLAAAAENDSENLMPYLIDCCHAYATVGEIVTRLKSQWGEFQEPVRL
jgi:methylmalonyl-CoA mutase N-terminal domain/subunit